MIELPLFPDTEWYLNEVKKLFVNGNRKKDIEYTYLKNIVDINNELEALGTIAKISSNPEKCALERLILAPFSELKEIVKLISNNSQSIFYEKEVDEDGKHNMKKVWKQLYDTYDRLIAKKLNIEMIKRYKIKCCPYCNENFIFSRGENAMAQLDHFYPRDKYPLFSLCLYNLVPSCYSCNHIKNNKSIGISPHDHSYDFSHFRFSYKPKSSNWINDYHDIDIQFVYDESDEDFSDSMKLNMEEMKINHAYKMHTDYVQEILKKAQIYSSERRSALMHDFPNLFNCDEEIIKTVFGECISNQDLLTRPLSKITKDILCELHLM